MSEEAVRRLRARRGLIGVVASIVIALLALPQAASAAPTAAPPLNPQPVWAMQQTGDLLRGFQRSDFNERDGAPRQQPAPDGRAGLLFQLKGGDQRSEVQPQLPDQVEGTVQWYRYRSLLASDFPTWPDTWQVLLQWHHLGDSGSPPVALEVRSNRLQLVAKGAEYRDLGPVRGGDHLDVKLRIAFSRNPATSSVDVWRDGQQVLNDFHPASATMLDAHDYLKVGYYRDTAIREAGRYWLQDLKAGDTADSVRTADDPPPPAPEAAPAPTDTRSVALLWAAGALILVVVLLLAGTTIVRRRRQD